MLHIAFGFLMLYCTTGKVINIQTPSTTIKQGTLSGSIIYSEKGREIFAFRGIPYAKPPVDELRFKLPVPADPWEGVFKADTKEIISCPQMNRNNVYTGQEDCLVLNVYTPSTFFSKTPQLPIMLYIHGGAFLSGSSMDLKYLPTKLLDKDVILVTVNYRLGILGFFSSGDDVIPGNFGLFDQAEAMKWVQENIISFGGDPDRVTIFGQSVGASAVTLHLVSPHSQNLFQSAIVQSSTYYGFRALANNPRTWAKRVAMKLKCPSVTMQQLLHCLRRKPAQELAAAPFYFSIVGINHPKIFTPVVENRPNGFLPFDPLQNSHNITIDKPVMIGTVSNEGYNLYQAFEPYFDQKAEDFLQNDFKTIFQGLHDNECYSNSYTEAISDYYFRNLSNTDGELFQKTLQQLYADLYNDVGVEAFLKLLSLQNTTNYAYRFSYRGSVCNVEYNCTNPGNRGPAHAEELPFLFPFQNITEVDSKVSETLVDLWTNFAIHQNPTPHANSSFHWLSTKFPDSKYLDINLKPNMTIGHLTNNVAAWTDAKKALNCILI